MAKHSYGAEYTETGTLIYQFNTKAERDAWVARGRQDPGPGERRPRTSKDLDVRAARAQVARGLQWPVQVGD